MSDEIFAGTAAYYARYRPGYPEEVWQIAGAAFGLDGTGTLLDLGAGTGQVALSLADRFEHVIATDISTEMVEEGRRQTQARGVINVEWHVLAAEEIATLEGGPYRLVTLGSAFHWMDQMRVLDLCWERTEPGGGIFLVALPGFISVDNLDAGDEVGHAVQQVVQTHLGEQRLAGVGAYSPPPKRWEDYLAESRYDGIEVGEASLRVEYDIDAVIGHLYSTSFANRRLLGDRVQAFERDMRAALLAINASGRYQREFRAEWALAYRR